MLQELMRHTWYDISYDISVHYDSFMHKKIIGTIDIVNRFIISILSIYSFIINVLKWKPELLRFSMWTKRFKLLWCGYINVGQEFATHLRKHIRLLKTFSKLIQQRHRTSSVRLSVDPCVRLLRRRFVTQS